MSGAVYAFNKIVDAHRGTYSNAPPADAARLARCPLSDDVSRYTTAQVSLVLGRPLTGVYRLSCSDGAAQHIIVAFMAAAPNTVEPYIAALTAGNASAAYGGGIESSADVHGRHTVYWTSGDHLLALALTNAGDKAAIAGVVTTLARSATAT